MSSPPSPIIALITGGSSGIGLELARQLVQQGSHVWIIARRPDRLAEALQALHAERVNPDQRLGMVPADVADPLQAQAAVDRVIEEIGLPDLVINSAGFARPGRFLEQDLEFHHTMMDVNYWGTVYVTRAVLPGMVQRGAGHVVNIASESGFLGLMGYVGYTATKFAVAGFSDALRAEIKNSGVRLHIVYPPDVDTPQLAYERNYRPPELQALEPLRSVSTPQAVAKAILKGVRRNQYMILPGFDSRFMYSLTRILGRGVYPVMDLITGALWKNWLKKNKKEQE